MRVKREAEGAVWGERLLVASLSCAVALLAGACSPREEASIRTAPAEVRNARLREAIHDAGYLCDEVIDATAPAESATGWRVLCTDMLVYLASLDTQDALHIEPIAYDDSVTPSITRYRDDATETVRPDP